MEEEKIFFLDNDLRLLYERRNLNNWKKKLDTSDLRYQLTTVDRSIGACVTLSPSGGGNFLIFSLISKYLTNILPITNLYTVLGAGSSASHEPQSY